MKLALSLPLFTGSFCKDIRQSKNQFLDFMGISNENYTN